MAKSLLVSRYLPRMRSTDFGSKIPINITISGLHGLKYWRLVVSFRNVTTVETRITKHRCRWERGTIGPNVPKLICCTFIRKLIDPFAIIIVGRLRQTRQKTIDRYSNTSTTITLSRLTITGSRFVVVALRFARRSSSSGSARKQNAHIPRQKFDVQMNAVILLLISSRFSAARWRSNGIYHILVYNITTGCRTRNMSKARHIIIHHRVLFIYSLRDSFFFHNNNIL